MTERQDPVNRAVELFVYAPIGAGLFLLDEVPGFFEAAVERGRSTVDQRITTARSTGEVALAFGMPMLRRKVESRVARMLGRDSAAPPPAPAPTPEPPTTEPPKTEPPRTELPFVRAAIPTEPWAPAPVSKPASAHAPPANGAPTSADLPIPGYDELSASQVVERLVGLAPSELDAVHAYEVANRQRRTILGKIEQLAV
jgi:hypothetical protein